MACNYPLSGLTGRCCPECGRPFDPADAKTFNPFVIYEHNFPDLAIAVALTFALLVAIGLFTYIVEWIKAVL